MASSQITHVSDTALWVAIYRAMESERPDALFRDPYARRLAGERGESIVTGLRRAKYWVWPHVVRTAVFDELIMRCVGQGADAVLNLAAGLDARAWRLDLPPSLDWIEVDYPDLIAFKRERLAAERPRCALEWAPADLVDAAQRAALIGRVGAWHRRVLVISEGLLVYLTAEQVAALAKDLHVQPSLRWWLFDLVSPRLRKMMKRQTRRQMRHANASFQFAPEENTDFFAPHGWKEVEFRGVFAESRRLKRLPWYMAMWRVMRLLASEKKKREFDRFTGVALMERT